MLENQHIRIPKKIETEDNLDFHFLRKTGIQYIEQLGSKLWTDFNSHDPGITILEVLSYAITDLGMRINLNTADILASDDKNKKLADQFFEAHDILSCKPVNELDYRKLFIDIGENRPIKNCWLLPKLETIYADCQTGELSFTKDALQTTNPEDFEIKGLYKILVDFDTNMEDCDKTNAKREILERFHENRNVGEDLVDIMEVEAQEIAVCTEIEVEKNVDEELVHAKILQSIQNYLSPEVHFYSLQHLLDDGFTTDEIFDGPVLNNGFINTIELENSQLRKEVRLSDLISEIMKVEGVKQIKEISIAKCGDKLQSGNDWLISIASGKKPILCELSSFSYSKGALPLNINQQKVAEYQAELIEEDKLNRDQAKLNKKLSLPEQETYALDSYTTILNDFPDTYGVGTNGIIEKPSPERKALAKQLKGYLLFYDKVLAGYFKHLAKVKDLLSVNGDLKKTYFTQALQGIKEFDELVSSTYTDASNDDQLTDILYEELDNNIERRNQILDHLIGRFAEKFSDYTFIMKALYGKSVDEIVLQNKKDFLNNYNHLSAERGLGHNYLNQPLANLWNSHNVSGTQKRIASLLGIKNYKRKVLCDKTILLKNIVTDGSDPIYKWKVKDLNNSGSYILSAINGYALKNDAYVELHEAIGYMLQENQEKEIHAKFDSTVVDGDYINNIKIKVRVSDSKFYFEIASDPDNDIIIASHNKYYTTQDELKLAILNLLTYVSDQYTTSPVVITTTKPSGETLYHWKINDSKLGTVLSSISGSKIEYLASRNLQEAAYQCVQIDEEDLENQLLLVLSEGDIIGNIRVGKITDVDGDKFYLEVLDDTDPQIVIADQPEKFYTIDNLNQGIRDLINYFKWDFTEEGIFLVEHLLLKPTSPLNYNESGVGCMIIDNTFIIAENNLVNTDDPESGSVNLMSTCKDGCDLAVFDPYSYRVSIVLPGYTYRFSDPDFRKYAETVIRQELPAHVLAKICWVGHRKSEIEDAKNDLIDFEKAYKQFLLDKAGDNLTALSTSTDVLITALTDLNNIYRPGRLLDCAQEDENFDGKIILGKSNL